MSASSNDKVDGVQKVAAFLLSLDKEISAKVMRLSGSTKSMREIKSRAPGLR